MRLLDKTAVLVALATATRNPHMLVEASAHACARMRASDTRILADDVLAEIERDGRVIVSGVSFVDGALEFCRIEKALVDQNIQGVSLVLAQHTGLVRRNAPVEAVVVSMDAARAA